MRINKKKTWIWLGIISCAVLLYVGNSAVAGISPKITSQLKILTKKAGMDLFESDGEKTSGKSGIKEDRRPPADIAEEAELEKDSKLIRSETIRMAGQMLRSDEGVGNGLGELNNLAVERGLETIRSELSEYKLSETPLITPTPRVETEESDDSADDDLVDVFTRDELTELQNKGAEIEGDGFGLVSGYSRSKPSASVGGNGTTKTATPAPTPEEKGLYTGQARGYAMLYLMHPKARQTVIRELQALIDSELHEIYLAVLTDGTFGQDFDYLKNVLRVFNDHGRLITLELYLTNGPTMRKYDTTDIKAGFNLVEPAEFRYLIQHDPNTREKFSGMVREVKDVLDYNARLNPGNVNLVSVMLEDNLQVDSYRAMRALAAGVLDKNVQFVRNPCPGCYPGNDADAVGDVLELHDSSDISLLKAGDGYTLDGVSFYFDWEKGGGLSIAQVKELQKLSYVNGLSYFGIWRAQRQGVILGSKPVNPNNRVYEIPTTGQIEEEISVLRDGLERMSGQVSDETAKILTPLPSLQP